MSRCLCPKWRLLPTSIFPLPNSVDPFSDRAGTDRKQFTPQSRYKTGRVEGSQPTDTDLHSIYILFACSLTQRLESSRKPPSLGKLPRFLGRSFKAFVPSPSPTSRLFARTPSSSWALFMSPPPPILAQLGSQCGAWPGAPGGDAAARHTPGAFVRAPRSRPLRELGTSCVAGWGGGRLARPGSDIAGE